MGKKKSKREPMDVWREVLNESHAPRDYVVIFYADGGQGMEEIRKAVERSKHSHGQICRATGIDQASLSRFMGKEKKNLRGDKLLDLMQFLGFQLVQRPEGEATSAR